MIQYPQDMNAKPTRTPMTTDRPHQVGVRFSETEYASLLEMAEGEGLRPATFVRRLILLALKEAQEPGKKV